MKKVFIDPGHGGSDSGARGRLPQLGTLEKDIVLAVGDALQSMLSPYPGVISMMSRGSDVFRTLSERAQMANDFGADLTISIHCNASEAHTATGYEVWTSPGQTQSDIAADLIFEKYGQAFPQLVKRRDTEDGDNDREANFAVLRRTTGPAVLVELEFIDSAKGERFLSDTRPEDLARPLLDAALEFLGLLPDIKKDPEPEPEPESPEPESPEPEPEPERELEVAIVEVPAALGVKVFEDSYATMLNEIPPWEPQGGVCFVSRDGGQYYLQAFVRERFSE